MAAIIYQFPFDCALSTTRFGQHHPAPFLDVQFGAIPLKMVMMNGLVVLNSGFFMVYLWGRFSAK